MSSPESLSRLHRYFKSHENSYADFIITLYVTMQYIDGKGQTVLSNDTTEKPVTKQRTIDSFPRSFIRAKNKVDLLDCLDNIKNVK